MAASKDKSGCLPRFFYNFIGRNVSDHLAEEYDRRSQAKFPANDAVLYEDMEAFPQSIAPYRLRDDFLSHAEMSLYYALRQIIGNQAALMVKVRLADVFFVARPHEHAGAFSQISQKHVDFLVCHAQTLKPLFGIELDDSSHQKEKRQKRDEFVNEVFSEAQLPLLRIPVQRSYDRAQLAGYMSRYFTASPSAVSPAGKEADPPSQSGVRVCPKCGVNMVLRTAKQGKHAGQQFYACPNYPRCRETAKA